MRVISESKDGKRRMTVTVHAGKSVTRHEHAAGPDWVYRPTKPEIKHLRRGQNYLRDPK